LISKQIASSIKERGPKALRIKVLFPSTHHPQEIMMTTTLNPQSIHQIVRTKAPKFALFAMKE